MLSLLFVKEITAPWLAWLFENRLFFICRLFVFCKRMDPPFFEDLLFVKGQFSIVIVWDSEIKRTPALFWAIFWENILFFRSIWEDWRKESIAVSFAWFFSNFESFIWMFLDFFMKNADDCLPLLRFLLTVLL